ncbi:MAG: hypothetical protein R2832_01220 [Rhodothermales bacterium]
MTYLTSRTFVATLALAAIGTTALVGTAEAQDERDSNDKSRKSVVIMRNSDVDGDSVRIEINDGRVWVNGEEVPEDADLSDYLPKGFKGSVGEGHYFGRVDPDDDGVAFWFDGKDDKGEGLHFWRRDEDGHPSSGRAFWGPAAPDKESFRTLRDNLVGFSGDLSNHAYAFFSDAADLFDSPEVMKMEMESKRLARRLEMADGDERAELSRQLDDVLQKIFDEKTRLKTERLEKLTGEVEELREEVELRKRDKDRIVSERKNELTGRNRKSDW